MILEIQWLEASPRRWCSARQDRAKDELQSEMGACGDEEAVALIDVRSSNLDSLKETLFLVRLRS